MARDYKQSDHEKFGESIELNYYNSVNKKETETAYVVELSIRSS